MTIETAWLAYLDDDDAATMWREVRAASSLAELVQLVSDWHVTAEALSDPARGEVLLAPRPLDLDDFVEVYPDEPT